MRSIITTILILFVFANVQAQPVLLKEIPLNSEQFVPGPNNKVFFWDKDSLWVSDGTTGGTKFVKDLGGDYPIQYNFYPEQHIRFGNYLIFVAVTISNGNYTIWRTDGTAANTVKITSVATYVPDLLYATPSEVFLNLYGSGIGRELWKLNSSFTLSLVKDLAPGPNTGAPYNMIPYKGKYYFLSGGNIWATDGTTAGTIQTATLNFGSLWNLTDVNGILYFSSKYFHTSPEGYEITDSYLLKSDGTTAGTSIVKIYADPYGDDPFDLHDFLSYKGKLYFFIYSYDFSEALWSSDGTSEGTIVIKNDAILDGSLTKAMIVNDYIVFYGYDQGYASWLYRSDGTPAGTTRFYNFNSLDPQDLTKVKNLLLFADHDAYSYYGQTDNYNDYYQLRQTDLTGKNVRSVRHIFGQGSYAGSNNLTDVNDKLFFTTYNNHYNAPDSAKVRRLWIYDPFKPAQNVPYFTLVNANTDKDIQWLKNNDTIYKKPGMYYNIRYNPVSTPGSVAFKLSDTLRRIENVAPYSLAGDASGNYSPWLEGNPGKHKLTANQYTMTNGKGTLTNSLTINFLIKEDVPNRPPVVNAGPDKTIILPTNSTTLSATVTDPDGDNLSGYWTRLSGPNYPSWYYLDDFTIQLEGLIEGEYLYRVYAYDTEYLSDADTIKVIVKKAPPTPSNPGLILVNAATDEDIRDMLNQDTIIYNSATDKITIRAIPSKAVGSIVFFLDGAKYRTETDAPYALKGDFNGDYTPWPATPGNHTLTATAYSGSGGSGSVVETRTINFLVKQGSTPTPSAQVTFTLVNAVTDQDIGPLVDGQTINLANLPTNKLNIRANSSMANTKSIVFDFDGTSKFKTESSAPYSLFGDNNGNYNEWVPPTGSHTLKAIPFTSTGGSGTAGIPLSITFTVTNNSTLAASEVKMYPNPANERMSISITNDPSENLSIIIYDGAGNKYYEGIHQTINGAADFGIELSALDMMPGLYFVKIRSADNTEKVVKLLKN